MSDCRPLRTGLFGFFLSSIEVLEKLFLHGGSLRSGALRLDIVFSSWSKQDRDILLRHLFRILFGAGDCHHGLRYLQGTDCLRVRLIALLRGLARGILGRTFPLVIFRLLFFYATLIIALLFAFGVAVGF